MIARAHVLRHHITRAYLASSRDSRQRGARWYPTARALVTRWARRYHYSRATVANVIAAISPQCDWPTNKRLARAVLQGQAPDSLGGALRVNLRKARRIRDARARDIAPYFPHGPKVQAFARNLIGDNRAITIDRHATEAAHGRIDRHRSGITARQYATLAQAYTDVAQALQRSGAELQAIIWVSWKHHHSRAPQQVRTSTRTGGRTV